jgi:hypothetical protein
VSTADRFHRAEVVLGISHSPSIRLAFLDENIVLDMVRPDNFPRSVEQIIVEQIIEDTRAEALKSESFNV